MIVGIYDSGVGGLNVLNKCISVAPYIKYIYYGDNTHAPYGNYSSSKLLRLAEKVFNYFEKQKVDLVIIACNTITTNCISILKKRYPFEIIGVRPAILNALNYLKDKEGKLLVLSTLATSKSLFIKEELKNISSLNLFPKIKIELYAPKNLAGEIESNIDCLDSVDLNKHLKKGEYIGVVLGCTHYEYLKNRIKDFYGVPIFTECRGIAVHFLGILSTMPKFPIKREVLFVNDKNNKNKKVFKKHFLS